MTILRFAYGRRAERLRRGSPWRPRELVPPGGAGQQHDNHRDDCLGQPRPPFESLATGSGTTVASAVATLGSTRRRGFHHRRLRPLRRRGRHRAESTARFADDGASASC